MSESPAATLDETVASDESQPDAGGGARGNATATSVYAFELPVRVWHWVNVACVVTLALTGYLIGSPPSSVSGEASDSFLFGYIRLIHFIAAQILAIAFVVRAYWALVGNEHSRQIFVLPVWKRSWWQGVAHEIKWYGFVAKEPKTYVGHNPLAQLAMFFSVTLGGLFMIVTGFALYAEGEGIDSWQYGLFGWVFDLWPNSQSVHTWHHLGMWVILTFVILHIYVVFREGALSGQSTLSTMWSGNRHFRSRAAGNASRGR